MTDDYLSELIGWQTLNGPLDAEIRDALATWTRLLENSEKEWDYLGYVREHAGFMLLDQVSRQVAISELELGADYRVDFAVGRDRGSYGFAYELIEIEKPGDPIFKRDGTPSHQLTHALDQVRRWKQWINANRDIAKKLFPSKEFIYHDLPEFHYKVVIGRRSANAEWAHRRREFAAEGVEIRTFDWLTDVLAGKQFFGAAVLASSEYDELSDVVQNQLANPFVEAYPSSAWRRLVANGRFSCTHMVASNAELLLEHRKVNERHKRFLEQWNALTPAERDRYRLDVLSPPRRRKWAERVHRT